MMLRFVRGVVMRGPCHASQNDTSRAETGPDVPPRDLAKIVFTSQAGGNKRNQLFGTALGLFFLLGFCLAHVGFALEEQKGVFNESPDARRPAQL
jgi:hypothetical protein